MFFSILQSWMTKSTIKTLSVQGMLLGLQFSKVNQPITTNDVILNIYFNYMRSSILSKVENREPNGHQK